MDTDHVNYLIYRYLQESGFAHSSFTFGQESGVTRSSVAGTKIPPGALLVQLQRALNYVHAEVCLSEEGTPVDYEDLGGVDALSLIDSVQPDVCEQRRQQIWAKRRMETDSKPSGAGAAKDSGAMEVEVASDAQNVRILKGHESEVFACAWNPTCDMIASGSGDSTARIWDLDSRDDDAPLVLRHLAPEGATESGEDTKDVTTLDWNRTGDLLATGSYDGAGRIWSKAGELKNRLMGHEKPIFSLKWNARGDYIVTCSLDTTAIVWNADRGTIKQRFEFHSAPCLDVDWRDDTSFASCSTDKDICVCKVGSQIPVRTYKGGEEHEGHIDEVNAIKWDSSGNYLASCSDDKTVKIWGSEQDKPLHTLSQGGKIYSLQWSEKAPGSKLPLMLASASFDCKTKVWDAILGKCLYTLTGHTSPVYSVAFSPNSQYLASGAFDHLLLVWSVETGELVQSYNGGGGIFEVCWNSEGSRIAACYTDNTVSVIDFSP